MTIYILKNALRCIILSHSKSIQEGIDMKKILALLLAAVLVLGMAACAASPAAPAQTSSDTAAAASDAAAAGTETPAASSGAKLRFVTGGESGT